MSFIFDPRVIYPKNPYLYWKIAIWGVVGSEVLQVSESFEVEEIFTECVAEVIEERVGELNWVDTKLDFDDVDIRGVDVADAFVVYWIS